MKLISQRGLSPTSNIGHNWQKLFYLDRWRRNYISRVLQSQLKIFYCLDAGPDLTKSVYKKEWRYFSCIYSFSSVQFSCSVVSDTLRPMNHSTPGLPVHHQLLEFTQNHVHRIGDSIQPSHPLSSPSLSAPNPSQHQGLFQWVNSSHEVAKVLHIYIFHHYGPQRRYKS